MFVKKSIVFVSEMFRAFKDGEGHAGQSNQ